MEAQAAVVAEMLDPAGPGVDRALQVAQYPIVTPVKEELETHKMYGLSVSEFYF
jgi:hypothetical protein